MNFDIDSEILDIAIQHYGKPTQILKLIEELHELSEVMCSMLVGGTVADTNEIYAMTRRIRVNLDACRSIKPKFTGMTSDKVFDTSDEIADCLLMIFQGIKIFENRILVQERIRNKENRLSDRIFAERVKTEVGECVKKTCQK